jgi:hypothetical protein
LRNDSLVANFLIGEYVFHHFGSHTNGALLIQHKRSHSNNPNSSWRRIIKPGDQRKSLLKLLGAF